MDHFFVNFSTQPGTARQKEFAAFNRQRFLQKDFPQWKRGIPTIDQRVAGIFHAYEEVVREAAPKVGHCQDLQRGDGSTQDKAFL
jgi:hypothetical protein